MPTITIKFILPEENEEFEMVTNAYKYKSFIDKVFDILRSAIKYEAKWNWYNKKLTEHDIELLDSLRNAFSDICDFD